MEPLGAISLDPTLQLIADLPFDAEKKQLIYTALRNNVKISPEKVIDIWEVATRQVPEANSSIIWLEEGCHNPVTRKGNGLIHIKEEHLTQFEDKGIAAFQMPELAMAATSRGWLVAQKGKRGAQSGTCVYVLRFNGNILAVAVLVANNGYIVTAHPMGWDKMLKLAKSYVSATELELLEHLRPR